MFRTLESIIRSDFFVSQLVYAGTSCDIQLQNVAPDDGLKSPKHVEHLMINKDSL